MMTYYIFTEPNRLKDTLNRYRYKYQPGLYAMQPRDVSDLELKFGVTDLRFIPPPELMYTPWAHKIAKDWFYETLDYNRMTYVQRAPQLNHRMALRHIQAIKSTLRVSPDDKINAMARLLTLWYESATEGRADAK